jgi:hypothetical protein
MLFDRGGDSERRSRFYFATASLLLVISFYTFLPNWNGSTIIIPTHIILSIPLAVLAYKSWSKTKAIQKKEIQRTSLLTKVIRRANKSSFVIAVGVVALIVLGGWVSSVGYNQSLQEVTATTTQSFTYASALMQANASTITTPATISIMKDQFTMYAGIVTSCNTYARASGTILYRQIHVSLSSSEPIDFWIFSPSQYGLMLNESARPCADLLASNSTFDQASVTTLNETVQMPKNNLYGYYYFVFASVNQEPASVNFEADVPLTYTITYTTTSTSISTTLTTNTVSEFFMTTQPVAIGGVFYSGLIIIILAIAMLFVTISKRSTKKRRLTTKRP